MEMLLLVKLISRISARLIKSTLLLFKVRMCSKIKMGVFTKCHPVKFSNVSMIYVYVKTTKVGLSYFPLSVIDKPIHVNMW